MSLAVLLFLSLLPQEARSQDPPPNVEYRTFHTENFRITHPVELDGLARTAAARAESAHAVLRESFFPPPPGPIDLLVTDHVDLSNGFARVVPSNRIVIWAQPPLDGLALSHFDEWLELLITHEVAHIFHLDYTGPLGRALRRVFGRAPLRWPYFQGRTLPGLATEGVAVHLETRHTRHGRLDGAFHTAVARTQALAGRMESLGQAMGGSPVWPAGDRGYVYGSLFFEHLARTRGEEAVENFLVRAAEQWIPYRLDAAARDAFGVSLQALWDEWANEVGLDAERIRARVESLEDRATEPELLTRGGLFAVHPVAGPRGTGVAYLRDDGRNDLRLVLGGSEGERTLSRWNTLMAPPRWTPDGDLLLPQADFVDSHRIHRDLYRVTLEGEVTRLTRGLRVLHADPNPRDGGILAVLGEEGTNRLVMLSDDGTVDRVLHEAAPGVHWSHPVWAPDGETFAVARRRPGGWSAVLVLDASGEVVVEVTEDRSLNAVPSWAPGGAGLVWSSDRNGVPNLYGMRFGTTRGEGPGELLQITDLATAGVFPSIDPEGDWIYLSVLGEDGWDVGRIPYDPDAWFVPRPSEPSAPPADDPPRGGAFAASTLESTPYSPLATLLPRYWLPVRIERETVQATRVLPEAWGASTAGVDLVGRHEYSIFAAAPIRDPERRVEWGGRYTWRGLGNPSLVFEIGQEWEASGRFVLPGAGAAPPDTVFPVRRERFAGGGFEWRRSRLRRTATLALGGRVLSMERSVLEADGAESETISFLHPAGTLLEARASAVYSTARTHPFSVSTEDGVVVGVSFRERWDRSVQDTLRGRPGADGAFREVLGSIRAFRGMSGPGFANHVLALRVAAGASRGPEAGIDHFSVGGAGRFFQMRGIVPGTLRGRHAWTLSGEWRFPLAILHRGFEAWPFHLDRLAGGVFLDAAGGGRDGEDGTINWDMRSSVGGELVLSHTVLFGSLDRLRLGVAVPLGPLRRASFYVRTGWSF